MIKRYIFLLMFLTHAVSAVEFASPIYQPGGRNFADPSSRKSIHYVDLDGLPAVKYNNGTTTAKYNLQSLDALNKKVVTWTEFGAYRNYFENSAGTIVTEATDIATDGTYQYMRMQTAASSSGNAMVRRAASSLIADPNSILTFKTRMRFGALSDGTNTYSATWGFTNPSLVTGVITYGAYFYYDGTNVYAVTVNNTGNTSSVNLGAPTTSWTKYGITINGLTNVVFSINGTNTTIATNLPTQPFHERITIVKSTGTAARSILVDWCASEYLFPTSLNRL